MGRWSIFKTITTAFLNKSWLLAQSPRIKAFKIRFWHLEAITTLYQSLTQAQGASLPRWSSMTPMGIWPSSHSSSSNKTGAGLLPILVRTRRLIVDNWHSRPRTCFKAATNRWWWWAAGRASKAPHNAYLSSRCSSSNFWTQRQWLIWVRRRRQILRTA